MKSGVYRTPSASLNVTGSKAYETICLSRAYSFKSSAKRSSVLLIAPGTRRNGRLCDFICLTSAVAICTISPIARKSVSMRCRDQVADRYRDRDVIRCNPDHIQQDRSTRQIASRRRLSFVLSFYESANLGAHINARSAWIDERIRNLSELS